MRENLLERRMINNGIHKHAGHNCPAGIKPPTTRSLRHAQTDRQKKKMKRKGEAWYRTEEVKTKIRINSSIDTSSRTLNKEKCLHLFRS